MKAAGLRTSERRKHTEIAKCICDLNRGKGCLKIGTARTSDHNSNQNESWNLEMMTCSIPKIYRLQREKIFSYGINYPIMQNMNYSLKESLGRLRPKPIGFSFPVRDL